MTTEEEKAKGIVYAKSTPINGAKALEFKIVFSPQTGAQGSEYFIVGKKYEVSIQVTKDVYSSQINSDDYTYEWVILSPPGLPFQPNFSEKFVEAYGKTQSFSFTPSEDGYSYFLQATVISKKSPNDTSKTKIFRYNSFFGAENVSIFAVSLAAGIILFIFLLVLLIAYLLNSQHRKKVAMMSKRR
jgi:hypothetical protein